MSDPLVRMLLQEAIGAVASPGLAAQALEYGLERAQLLEIPSPGPDLTKFITNDLRHAIAELIGEDAAESVMMETRVLCGPAMAPPASTPPRELLDTQRSISLVPPSIADRISDLPQDVQEAFLARTSLSGLAPLNAAPPGVTMPSPEIGMPMVLISTIDADRVRRLTELLDGDAAVHVVTDAVALVGVLGMAQQYHPFIVLDCTNPGIAPENLASMAPMLPSVTVLLWGIEKDMDRALSGNAFVADWVRIAEDGKPQAVAELILGMIE